jgi:hypothetical protein
MEAAMNQTKYLVVADFAGVKFGRSSSPIERFADANRAAMAHVTKTGRRAAVLAELGGRAEMIVTYGPGPETGRPVVVCVGDVAA